MAKSSFGVRNYRSSVKGRRPQPADMDYGDLAINYNHADPALIIKGDDNTLIEFKPGSVTVSAVAPVAAKDGDLWWDSTSARLFVRYTAGAPPVSVWVDASPAAVPPSVANALTYKGTADPTVPRAAGTAVAVGDTYVASKAGTADASWTGLGGQAVSLHELLMWDGSEWAGGGAAASSRTAWQGKVDVTAAKPAGYAAMTGDLVEVSKVGVLHPDWATVPADAAVGSVLVYDGTGWVLLNKPPQAATESASGVVELATAAEVTAGTDATRAVHPAGLKVELDKKAPLASPALTGTPTAPTAAAGARTTQIATTAFVADAVSRENLWDRAGSTAVLSLTVAAGSSAITATGTALQNVAQTSSSGNGAGLSVDLTVTGGVVTSAKVSAGGANYALNDVVVIDKAKITGATTDVVLTVAGLNSGTVYPSSAADVVNFPTGTVTSPGLTPKGIPGSGLYSSDSNQLGIAVNGKSAISMDAVGRCFFSGDTTVDLPFAMREFLAVFRNAAFSVGTPGSVPFGVGPVPPSGPASNTQILGLGIGDYSPVHRLSGSLC